MADQIGQTGRTSTMAFAKFGDNSWGVAASVTVGVYFQSDGGIRYQPQMIQDPSFNQAFLGQAEPGLVESPEVSLTGRARYTDWQYVWEALAMGSPTAGGNPNIQTSTSGQQTSWSHVIDLAKNTDGLGLTYAINKGLYVEELTSAKVVGFTLESQDDGSVNQTFRVKGSKITDSSAINVAATVDSASYPAIGNRLIMQQGQWRINLNAGGALAAADNLDVEGFRIDFDRPQEAPHILGQDFVAAPADEGHPTVTVELRLPRMNTVAANSAWAPLRSGTAFKADLTFSGAFINSTDQYKVLYEFPYLQFMPDGFIASMEEANQVKPVWRLMANLAPTSPTGMAFVNPMRITRINANSPGAFDTLP